MNLNNNANSDSLNGKMHELGAKAKDFLNDEKKMGSKAIEEVKTITADVVQEVKTQVNDLASESLDLIRRNPVIAIAAAVTVGLIVAKMVSRPRSETVKLSH